MECEQVRNDIAKLEAQWDSAGTHIESRKIRDRIVILQNRLKIWSDSKRLETYKELSEPLLSVYRSVPRPSIDINAGCSFGRPYHPTDVDRARIDAIMNYLALANNYIKIEYVCTGLIAFDPVNRCGSCCYDLTYVSSTNSGIQVCPECGTNNNYRHPIIFDPNSNTSLTPSSKSRGYEDIGNFRKTFRRYLGEIKPTVDMDKLVESLDQYFISRKMGSGLEMRNRDRDERGRCLETSVTTMVNALKATGYSSCYEDINYICHYYWDWPLPNAKYLEEIIMEDYRCTQEVWANMSEAEKGRKSSISTHYRLFKHLQIRGFQCYITDFKMPQPSTIQAYDNLFRIMCERCGRPDIIFTPT
jgi:hypothetical protein